MLRPFLLRASVLVKLSMAIASIHIRLRTGPMIKYPARNRKQVATVMVARGRVAVPHRLIHHIRQVPCGTTWFLGLT